MVHSRFSKKGVPGFTLIELMVSLFIMAVATSLLLANYPDSTLRIRLLNNTHNLALFILEAQRRGSAIDTTDDTIGGYGVLMSLTTTANTSPNKMALFSDSTGGVDIRNGAGIQIGDSVYDITQSPNDKIKSTLEFEDGFPIKKLCVVDVGAPSGFLCNDNNVPVINTLTVSFSRPSQVAHIYINNSTSTDYMGACIQPYSPKTPASGHVRSVIVYHSGMVTTRMEPCD